MQNGGHWWERGRACVYRLGYNPQERDRERERAVGERESSTTWNALSGPSSSSLTHGASPARCPPADDVLVPTYGFVAGEQAVQRKSKLRHLRLLAGRVGGGNIDGDVSTDDVRDASSAIPSGESRLAVVRLEVNTTRQVSAFKRSYLGWISLLALSPTKNNIRKITQICIIMYNTTYENKHNKSDIFNQSHI